ncbi:L-type lectin-domain containing receptor kinase S.4-like isoform X2 [Cryptomeria japonica]|nr:L-type lectin-domain containing receptor kinase S.4-like isoform X2 [Cryptomeria japonica]
MPGAETFLPLVLAFYFSLYFVSMSAQQQQKSADFIFEGFKDSNLSLSGVAKVDSRGILELTNVTKRLQGHAFYPFPLQFRNFSSNFTFSFSTTFVMSIVPQYPTLGGHGLAFVVTPSRTFEGSLPSQYFGMFNSTNNGMPSNQVFAVEFDTVRDFEFNDIDDNHVGVDVNSLFSSKSATVAFMNESGLYQKFNLKAEKSIQCWIDFDGGDKSLNVSVMPGGMTKPNVPLISMHLDLSGFSGDFMYVGFSSSTGLLSSAHSVLGWSFKMNGPARDLDLSKLLAVLESQSEDKPNKFPLGVCVAAVVVMTLVAEIHIVRRLRDIEVIENWELEYGSHRFSYKELRVATKGFRDSELLGTGGFGKVYKGVLPSNGLEVAVKGGSLESKQGLRQFIAEISSIGKLRHQNLVQLHGWCRYKRDLLLVYDYMPNGGLDKFLFGDNENVLSWEQRYAILKGVASGLLYLHEEWEQRVVHRDVKASNVLLDADMNARLGDFGFARLYEHGTDPYTTRVVGTLGYLAPELSTRTGKATTCADVFAFGAVLLEVACGRKPIEPKYSPEELVLVEWVWEMHSTGNTLNVVDPKLGNEYAVREAELVLQLGLLCSHPRPEARPNMRQVVQILAGDIVMPALPSGAPSADTPQTTPSFDELVVSFSSYKQSSLNTNSQASASSIPDRRLPLSLMHGRD